jgi:glycerol-3-phosphate dehydrogenase
VLFTVKRNLTALSDKKYDIVIIGGGIYGACLAWEATLRGCSVALVEKADFGSATSANSLKTIHGGLRYLQHADFKRMRESINERATLMRIAPHLVHPLPILMPTYGHGLKGKEVMTVAMWVNDLLSYDRNRLDDPQKHIPRGQAISKAECLKLLPNIQQKGLTGAAIFYDAQVYNSERLIIALLRSAVAGGAQVANYAEVTGFLKQGDTITGVQVKDQLDDTQFDIRAKWVINTAGPWIKHLDGTLNEQTQPIGHLATALNIITDSLFEKYAVGLSSRSNYQDQDAILNKGSRFFFFTPWRGHTIIGTDYQPFTDHPDTFRVTEADIASFLEEVNQTYPYAQLGLEDVRFVHGGLVPMSGLTPETNNVRLTKHFQIHDHRQDGITGLLSVTGVKYTTARHVAEKVMDYVAPLFKKTLDLSASATTPLYGGQIPNLVDFIQDVKNHRHDIIADYAIAENLVERLVYNYGSAYPAVLRYADSPAADQKPLIDDIALLKAEIRHAVQDEMAVKLADVVFRRTELGTAYHPGEENLQMCTDVMGTELGWTPAQISQEREALESLFCQKTPNEALNRAELADPVIQ